MSAPKLYLPMLDGLMLGEAMSDHNGVRCYPAIRHSNQEKYIVKVISVPASQVQLDALLLTGAFPSRESALEYYMDVARDMLRETDILRQLSHQEGFIPYLDAQIVSNDDFTGYEVYLLSNFRHSLERILETEKLTHRDIIRMGLDLCAALSASRREGYLYVDLKPTNIFFSEDHGYRIGDVGFASIASLPYSSLPEKYRSRYSAPEMLDEMSVLNDRVDVYALGLVLYQAYNGGDLPETECGQVLPAPLYADYEFAHIIMKACHPDASKRWADPMELAQAIIEYLKSNPLSDDPIIPVVPEQVPEEPEDIEEFLPEYDAEQTSLEMAQIEETDYEELAFFTDLGHNQDDSNEVAADMPVSEEISEMLAQADELIAHELPEPAIAPDPIEVPMPERITLEEESEPADEDTNEQAEVVLEQEPTKVPEAPAEAQPPSKDDIKKQDILKPKRRFPWKLLASCLVIAALLCAGFGGYYYYENIYLQRIDDLVLEQNGNVLSVKVVSAADNALLTVVCSDSYGNTIRRNVIAGIALFTDLDPQTHYALHVEISGFHKLIGDISDSFTTDPQTQITDLTASIGNEDGSVLLRFDTEGPRSANWVVSYGTSDGTEQRIVFQGNVVQISDLKIGAEYTFTLSREDGQTLSGKTQVQYTASKILLAHELSITACGGGSLTAQWAAPENAPDILWIVRCYNASGYDQTITTNDLTATFTGMEHNVACTVEVTAEGMPRTASITIEANPISVDQFHFTLTDGGMLEVLWDYTGIASSGWLLEFSIDGSALQSLTITENSAKLPLIPGGNYTVTVTALDATRQFGGTCDYSYPEADIFQGWGITANDLQGALCIRPEGENWYAEEISDDQFVSEFAPGQKVGLVFRCVTEPEMSDETVTILFVFYDSNGALLYVAETEVLWSELWTGNLCQMDLPPLPEELGSYTFDLYFNGQYVTELSFSVSEAE